VTTQHSLPSGRYSLLGPDSHRLDRTSLRLAHSFHHLITRIDEDRQHANLSSTIRLFVLEHFRRLASEAAPAEGNHS
jgi:predicted DNA-binding ribbon-helix-helix protein